MRVYFLIILLLCSISHSIDQRTISLKNKRIIEKITDPQRAEILAAKRIIRMIRVKPGMHIVDIGAGVGTYSFQFAKELHGDGIVYATEIDRELLNIIEQKNQSNKNNNLVQTVLVTANGLDDFYKRHNFDVIFMCSVLPHIANPLKYLKELKSSLKPGTGRIYIISKRKYPNNYNLSRELQVNKGKKISSAELNTALLKQAGYTFVAAHSDSLLEKGDYYFLEFKR